MSNHHHHCQDDDAHNDDDDDGQLSSSSYWPLYCPCWTLSVFLPEMSAGQIVVMFCKQTRWANDSFFINENYHLSPKLSADKEY